MLRGQVRSMETEWDDIREQIRKGYQRMEKAHERSKRRHEDVDDAPTSDPVEEPRQIELHGFAKKLQEMKGA